MRIAKISLLLIAFYFNANSQEINWESKTPLPLGHHSGSAVTCNGKIYHVGGQKKNGASSTKSNQMFEFDPAKNEWTEKSNMPTARFNLATASVMAKFM
jgi:N-acetylneuraminic acid mutarotase